MQHKAGKTWTLDDIRTLDIHEVSEEDEADFAPLTDEDIERAFTGEIVVITPHPTQPDKSVKWVVQPLDPGTANLMRYEERMKEGYSAPPRLQVNELEALSLEAQKAHFEAIQADNQHWEEFVLRIIRQQTLSPKLTKESFAKLPDAVTQTLWEAITGEMRVQDTVVDRFPSDDSENTGGQADRPEADANE